MQEPTFKLKNTAIVTCTGHDYTLDRTLAGTVYSTLNLESFTLLPSQAGDDLPSPPRAEAERTFRVHCQLQRGRGSGDQVM